MKIRFPPNYKGDNMKTVYVVVAHDQTGYRLVKVFSFRKDAENFKLTLTELLWKRITIETCVMDEAIKPKK